MPAAKNAAKVIILFLLLFLLFFISLSRRHPQTKKKIVVELRTYLVDLNVLEKVIETILIFSIHIYLTVMNIKMGDVQICYKEKKESRQVTL